jgi:cation/acetate symporter
VISERADRAELSETTAKLVTVLVLGVAALLIILTMFERLGVPLSSLMLAALLAPLALYLLIGFSARAQDADDYYVAGRAIPSRLNGMAAAMGSASAFAVFGLAGADFNLGYDGLALGLGWTAGFALSTLLVAPYLRRSGAVSIPDFIGARFGALCRILAAGVVVISSVTLLAAELSLSGLVFSRALGIGYDEVVYLGLAAVVAATVLGGMRAVSWTLAVQYLLVIAAYLGVLMLLSAKTYGLGLPQLDYGRALDGASALETALIEKGLADAATLKPHAKAFLQVDQLNFFALTFSLMTGTAAFAHVATRFLTAPSAREARLAGAWGLFFVFLIAVSAPALAALTKLEIYALIERGTSLAALPDWLVQASGLGLVRIHGVSLHMLETVRQALDAGAGDLSAVAAFMKSDGPNTLAAWSSLAEPVKITMLETARSAPMATPAEAWSALQSTILSAAAGAGNSTGQLTEGALTIDGPAIALMAPQIAGASLVLSAMAAAAAVGAAIATANVLLLTVANTLGHDVYQALYDRSGSPGRGVLVSRALLVVIAALAAIAVATLRPADSMGLAIFAFSLAAAGLFPALVLAIWWRRANGWGAAAGIVAGLGVALYYWAATRYFPVGFYEMWGPLSNAGSIALERYGELKAAWSAAAGEAKATAAIALEEVARGTETRAGLANWFGVNGASASLFAVPIGFCVMILVSFLTPRPKPEQVALVERLRDPLAD